MSCEWCDNICSLLNKWLDNYEGDENEIVLDEDYKKFYVIVDGWHKLEINYCPNCGRKLK